MTNFKSGSGNLDFDSDDGDDQPAEGSEKGESSAGEEPERSESAPEAGLQPDTGPSPEAADEASTGETYPYFVRRSNVGDERDTRLEIHVRDKVAEGEATFRHALAAELGTSDVSKTDAREFALLAAYRHPERVAKLMREEGFDSLG